MMSKKKKDDDKDGAWVARRSVMAQMVSDPTRVFTLQQFVQLYAPHLVEEYQQRQQRQQQRQKQSDKDNQQSTTSSTTTTKVYCTTPEENTVEYIGQTTVVVPLDSWPLIPIIKDNRHQRKNEETRQRHVSSYKQPHRPLGQEQPNQSKTLVVDERDHHHHPPSLVPPPPPPKRKFESLSSLIDHVVWTLVKRRERSRQLARQQPQQQQRYGSGCGHGRGPSQQQQQQNNVLCQGYAMASSQQMDDHGARSVRTMPTGVVLLQLNRNVEFLKRSSSRGHSWGSLVHDWLGDDFLRTLLLHTQLFLPIVVDQHNDKDNNKNNEKEKDEDDNEDQYTTKEDSLVAPIIITTSRSFRGNYWQLTGPPLVAATGPTASTGKRRRKRRRKQQDQQPGKTTQVVTTINNNDQRSAMENLKNNKKKNSNKRKHSKDRSDDKEDGTGISASLDDDEEEEGKRKEKDTKRDKSMSFEPPPKRSSTMNTSKDDGVIISSKSGTGVAVDTNTNTTMTTRTATTTTTRSCSSSLTATSSSRVGASSFQPRTVLLQQQQQPATHRSQSQCRNNNIISCHTTTQRRFFVPKVGLPTHHFLNHRPPPRRNSMSHPLSPLTVENESASSHAMTSKLMAMEDAMVSPPCEQQARSSKAVSLSSSGIVVEGDENMTKQQPPPPEEMLWWKMTGQHGQRPVDSHHRGSDNKDDQQNSKNDKSSGNYYYPFGKQNDLSHQICQSVVRNHRKCDYARILEHYCPLPDYYYYQRHCGSVESESSSLTATTTTTTTTTSNNNTVMQSPTAAADTPTNKQEPKNTTTSNTRITPTAVVSPNNKRGKIKVDLAHVSASFAPAQHVVSFLKSVVSHVFPAKTFWGSTQNLTRVLQHVECFVNLRRQEHYPFQNRNHLLHGIRITKMAWLFHYDRNKTNIFDDDNNNNGEDKNNTMRSKRRKRKRNDKAKGQQSCPFSPSSLPLPITTTTNTIMSRRTRKQQCVTAAGHQAAEQMFVSVLEWLFQDFIIPLLHSCFHTTESEMYGRRVLYYRKPVWSLFCSLSMQKLLPPPNVPPAKNKKKKKQNPQSTNDTVGAGGGGGGMYQTLTLSEAATRLSQQEIGISRLRLLPKRTGVRPIAMQSNTARIEPFKKRHRDGTNSPSPPTTTTTEITLEAGENGLITTRKKRKVEQGQLLNAKTKKDGASPTERTVKTRKAQQEGLQQQKDKETATNISILSERKPSTNATLNDAFAVLRKQYLDDPSLFGVGVAGLHFFYPRYRKYLIDCRRQSCAITTKPSEQQRLYFASVDIQHCYDNINQEKLLELVDRQLLTEDQYMVQRVGVTHCKGSSDSCASLSHNNQPQPQSKTVLHRKHCHVESPETFEPSGQTLLKKLNCEYHHAIFRHAGGGSGGGNSNTMVMVSKKRIMAQLSEHLKSHILVAKGRFNERFLVQRRGIPQGSILSSLLCNLYYGSVVEKKLGLTDATTTSNHNGKTNSELTTGLAEFPKTPPTYHSMLTRMVDDFMLVSQEPKELTKFIQIMDKGDEELGVHINKDKTRVSVEVSFRHAKDHKDSGCNNPRAEHCIKPQGTQRFFPWCGMLFDTRTGAVRIDYSRFHFGKARDTITVDYSCKEKSLHHQVLTQLQIYVRPRCLPILFDSLINGHNVQCINYYQLFFFAAVKLAFYLDDYATYRGGICQTRQKGPTVAIDYAVLLDSVESTITFAYRLVSSRVAQQKEKHQPFSSNQQLQHEVGYFSLKRERATWLGWKAVHDVFVRLERFQIFYEHIFYRLSQLSVTTERPSKQLIRLVRQARREMEPVKLLAVTL